MGGGDIEGSNVTQDRRTHFHDRQTMKTLAQISVSICRGAFLAIYFCRYSCHVIDALGQGFHLTDVNHGVQFKFFTNKPPVQVSWTDAAFRNGWLALDRNGNGLIDDATELFGNLTSQPQNPNRNGYIALAVFDDPQNGGNGNGLIDPRDTVYDRLRVWIDANHNGVSEPGELHRLRELGVFSIDLRYRMSKYVDPNGNQFRYQARIRDQAGRRHDACYDVILEFEFTPTNQ